MQDDSIDHLIRDAYSVVAKPERLMKLLSMLQSPKAKDEHILQPHFAAVVDLLGEVDPSVGSDFSSYVLNSDDGGNSRQHSDLLLDSNLKVIAYNQKLFSSSPIKIGETLPETLLGYDKKIHSQLKSLLQNESNNPLLLRLFAEPGSETGAPFAAERSNDDSSLIDLRAIRLRWYDHSGDAFAQSFKLTETEKKLSSHLINGGAVREFASGRNRSLATVRTQLKQLLKKLGIGSQTDLISLYAGFHGAFLNSEIGNGKNEESAGYLHFPDGNRQAYETYGRPSDTPVIYLHATADGAYFTPRQLQAIEDNNLHVIAPWLPFYAGGTMSSSGLDAVDEFIDRLIHLLDRLDVQQCIIVSARVAAPYGCAAIQRDPTRFAGLVMAGAILPADNENDFSHLALGYRAPLRLAKIAPSFVRLYFAATASMVRKGKGSSFFESLYGDSPADMKALHSPEVAVVMKKSLQRTFEDGYESTAQQAILTASDWSKYCHDIKAPVTVISGKEDGLAPPDMVEKFCAKYGWSLKGPLQDVGSLAIHQIPEMVFEEAARMGREFFTSN